LRFKWFNIEPRDSPNEPQASHKAALHQHSRGAPLSSPPLKRFPEFTRERCEVFERATALEEGPDRARSFGDGLIVYRVVRVTSRTRRWRHCSVPRQRRPHADTSAAAASYPRSPTTESPCPRTANRALPPGVASCRANTPRWRPRPVTRTRRLPSVSSRKFAKL